MFAKTSFGLALVLATASVALAAPKHTATVPATSVQTVYNPSGAYVRTDPDANVRFDLKRDADHGRY
jgi:hypothetical protein